MMDEARLKTIDLTDGTSPEEDVLWALNFLLNLPADDDMPLVIEDNKNN
ncbi:MAG: hypothetical protein IJT65_03785 [Eubacterium sp.]|nr:hypothetical protein [Eubacterium sp.]